MQNLQFILMAIFGYAVLSLNTEAVELKDLPYPNQTPDANTIARQVFFVNRLFAFSNLSLGEHPKAVSVIVDQTPGKKQTLTTVERHVNNTYNDGEIASRELSVFRSGKLKGTAVLLTDYKDPAKNPTYTLWLPVLRHTRVIEISDTNDTWGGTVFTYSEMLPNNPDNQRHELLDTIKFNACLGSVQISARSHPRWASVPDSPVCKHKGKQVYKLKSTPGSSVGWYDFRISYIDTKSFADYRKNDNKIKIVDRDWRASTKKDPRALQWHHIYGKDLITGHETYIVVPGVSLAIDTDKKPSFWSESTLKSLKIK